MAYITLNRDKLKRNYTYLNSVFNDHDIQWSIVTKMLCGNDLFLKEVLDLGIKQICDSRVTNLKHIKKLDDSIETIYIKPPSKRYISSIVEFADISLNTEIETIKLLSTEAKKQNKTHQIIIMIELGELREGIMRENIVEFYSKIFELDNIRVVGIGTNLTCLNGVLPNQDKLIQLGLYKQLIELKFGKKIPYVSGGSSVTIPLILDGILPKDVNHFRVGETLFLGTDVYHNTPYDNMEHEVFSFYSRIIELHEKPLTPSGKMGANVSGETQEVDESHLGERSYRAIIDLGKLDVDENHITPKDDSIEIIGGSSDMFVLDLKDNKENYKVGDLIEFSTDYVGTLRLMNSQYITKEVV
jgi:predicted amino acid racemase